MSTKRKSENDVNKLKQQLQQQQQAPPTPRSRSSAITPPDRHADILEANTRRMSQYNKPQQLHPFGPGNVVISGSSRRPSSAMHMPNLMIKHPQDNGSIASSTLNRRTSCVQPPPSTSLQVPVKSSKQSDTKTPLLLQGRVSTSRPSPLADLDGASRGHKRSLTFQRRSKMEMEEYHSMLKSSIGKFRKCGSSGSLTSGASTVSSMSSFYSMCSDFARSESSAASIGGSGEWSMRWCLDKPGKHPGQVKCVKGMCFLRNGNLVVAEAKNSRIQLFSSTGKSLAILGPESEYPKTALSFQNPTSFRRMQPTGICETMIDNIVAVTDLNRLLYIEATTQGGLEVELPIKDKTCLQGVAVTQNKTLILSEVGMQSSVGIFDSGGRIIRDYKGDFKKPSYVSWNDEYEIAAVSDSDQHCVYLYDVNGHLINKFGQLPKLANGVNQSPEDEAISTLVYPSGICWLTEGRILVADRAENRVVLYDMRNMAAEVVLSEANGLKQPVALATNLRNRIVVTEEFYDFEVDKYRLKMFKNRGATGHD